jgi:hypothetical protein
MIIKNHSPIINTKSSFYQSIILSQYLRRNNYQKKASYYEREREREREREKRFSEDDRDKL